MSDDEKARLPRPLTTDTGAQLGGPRPLEVTKG